MKLTFAPEARDEFRHAYDYYLPIDRSLAREFAKEVARAVQVVRDHPHRWAQISPALRKYRLNRFPYSVIYMVRGDTVKVVAIAHASRRPGYWNRRA